MRQNFQETLYKPGDRVKLAGIKGDVIDVGVLRTTIMEVGEWVDGDLYNGRVVRITNSFVFKEPVFNYSSEFPFLWDEIQIPVRYGSDYEMARKLLTDCAEKVIGEYTLFAQEAWEDLVQKFMIEDAKIDPVVSMSADENWVTFIVRYVVDYKKRRSTKDRLFTEIIKSIDNTSGQVVMATATLEISMTK